MKLKIKNILCFFSFLLVVTSSEILAVEEPVQLTSGQVAGVKLNSGIKVYRGIPFAAPPVGDLRWKPPQAPIPWSGVLQADSYGPVCMQQGTSALMSEDCLYVNVWTGAAAASEKRPVMVWIHGGGWSSGASVNQNSSSTAITSTYDGEALAKKGVILVSINYRLNNFGFMAHPALSAESPLGISGNYGILDHLAALEWVSNNISEFGGDPNNVTIFGESAGGASIYALVATPKAEGLFHKAIAQSVWVTPTNMTNLKTNNGLSESAEDRGQKAIANEFPDLELSIDVDLLTKMRALSAEDILRMPHQVSLIEDGWLFPKSAPEIFEEGSQNQVPLLAGINDGEGMLFIRAGRSFTSVAEQRAAREAEFGEFAGNLLNYYVAESEDEVLNVEIDYNTDSWFARPTRELVQSMVKTNTPSYMYVFTRNLQNPALRSPHAMELQYVFNLLPQSAGTIDVEIAQLMSDYWVQFATNGNPNRTGLPRWPAYNLETREHQVIGADVLQGSFLLQEKLDELDRYVQARYDSAR